MSTKKSLTGNNLPSDDGKLVTCRNGIKEETKVKRTAREIAEAMMKNSPERKEAEKMMGKSFEDLAPEQRVLAAEVLAAFDGMRNK